MKRIRYAIEARQAIINIEEVKFLVKHNKTTLKSNRAIWIGYEDLNCGICFSQSSYYSLLAEVLIEELPIYCSLSHLQELNVVDDITGKRLAQPATSGLNGSTGQYEKVTFDNVCLIEIACKTYSKKSKDWILSRLVIQMFFSNRVWNWNLHPVLSIINRREIGIPPFEDGYEVNHTDIFLTIKQAYLSNKYYHVINRRTAQKAKLYT